jgi:hypothetical protein
MSSLASPRRRRIAFAGLFMVGFASLVACAGIAGIDKLAIGACKGGEPCDEQDGNGNTRYDGNGGGIDNDDGPDHPSGSTCPTSTKGATMVSVGTDGNRFCVDSTETTVGQYNKFLADSPNTADQPAQCWWNQSFVPANQPNEDLPQVDVDWCDAVAYCKWAGKRLCGKIVNGKDPGAALALNDLASTDTDQWYIACSANGKKQYSYGDTLEPGNCNLLQNTLQSVKAPGSFPKCVGGSPGITDMVGNVWEWIDYCELAPGSDGGPSTTFCYSRGGSFGTAEQDATCKFNGTIAPMNGRNDQIGIRCCYP